MKAWEIGDRTGLSGLRRVERPDPVAGPRELLVRVTAAGLNYRDLMIARGDYAPDQPDDRIPLSDGVGIIEAVGEDVSGFSPGERVIAAHFPDWDPEGGFGFHVFARDLGVNANGWLAQRIALPAKAAIRVPDPIPDETAATLAVVAATVWHAMAVFGEAGPGKLVLSQGTGGVAIFSLLVAKALGADFAITSSSDEKLDRARALGADFAVNYRARPDWAAAFTEASGGRLADIVVDTIGFGEFANTLAATGPGGRIGTIGALSAAPGTPGDFGQGALLGKNITIKGITSGHRAMIEAALELMARKGITMPIDRAFGFDEARSAYEHLESGAHFGKVMIRM